MGLGEQYELETTGRITPEVGQRLAAPPGSRFDADDRGNVVDFYSLPDNEQVARLDREAVVNGKIDQLAFFNWSGGAALETWMRNNGYGDQLDRAARL